MAAAPPPPQTSAPGVGTRILETLKVLAQASFGVLKMDRDVVAETVRNPPPLPWAVGLYVLSAVSWGVGFHSWRMVFLRPLLVLGWLLAATLLARKEGGAGRFVGLLRAFSVVVMVDAVVVVGAVGQMAVVLVTAWWVMILAAMVEEQHELGATPAVKISLKALMVSLGVLLLLATVDAKIRGQYKWFTPEDGQAAPQGTTKPDL